MLHIYQPGDAVVVNDKALLQAISDKLNAALSAKGLPLPATEDITVVARVKEPWVVGCMERDDTEKGRK